MYKEEGEEGGHYTMKHKSEACGQITPDIFGGYKTAVDLPASIVYPLLHLHTGIKRS